MGLKRPHVLVLCHTNNYVDMVIKQSLFLETQCQYDAEGDDALRLLLAFMLLQRKN